VPVEFDPPQPANLLTSIDLDPAIVYDVLRNLPGKYSSGPDGLPTIYYKKLAVVLALPLSIIFQASLRLGNVPNDWRCAIIKPIFKRSGKNCDPASYRPVSLTSVACKVMEKLLKVVISNHCEINNILPNSQHGGRRARSTTTQLLECTDFYLKGLDAGIATDVILLDVAKAFDTVSHSKLLFKLHSLGIRGEIYAWIKAYLSNRSQSVRVGTAFSNFAPVSSGVPQGGVLSGLLFLIYISDIAHQCQSITRLFFDDIKLINSCTPEGHKAIQSDLAIISAWLSDWQLTLSASKCSCLHVHGKLRKCDCPATYILHELPLTNVSAVRDLGIIFDAQLNFGNHINSVVNKASRLCGGILRSFVSRDAKFMYQLFQTFVLPILDYGAAVWFPVQNARRNALATKLENVQRRFTKRLSNLGKLSYADRLHVLGCKSIVHRSMYLDLILFYKYLNGSADIQLSTALQTFCSGHHTRLSSTKRLQLPGSQITNTRDHLWLNRCVKLWHKLPIPIINTPNINAFKFQLDEFNLESLSGSMHC